jgi:hypothetical protein
VKIKLQKKARLEQLGTYGGVVQRYTVDFSILSDFNFFTSSIEPATGRIIEQIEIVKLLPE